MNTNPETETASELYPNVAAVSAIYGDTNGKYSGFLSRVDETYPAEPYFLWNQLLSDNGWVSRNPNYGGRSGSTKNNTGVNNNNSGNGTSSGGSTKDNSGGTNVVARTMSLATLFMLAAWILS